MKTIKLKSVVLASLAVLAMPTLALASSPGYDNKAMKVAYDDLNIHSEAGAKKLYTRLQRASAKVCEVRSLTESGSLRRYAETQACFDDVLSTAVAKVGSKELAEIHSS